MGNTFKEKEEYTKDMVNNPVHYSRNELQPIDIIEDWFLSFSIGNAIKYLMRAGFKNINKKNEDYDKAIWYLNRSLESFELESMINKYKPINKKIPIDHVLEKWNDLHDNIKKVIEKLYWINIYTKRNDYEKEIKAIIELINNAR